MEDTLECKKRLAEEEQARRKTDTTLREGVEQFGKPGDAGETEREEAVEGGLDGGEQGGLINRKRELFDSLGNARGVESPGAEHDVHHVQAVGGGKAAGEGPVEDADLPVGHGEEVAGMGVAVEQDGRRGAEKDIKEQSLGKGLEDSGVFPCVKIGGVGDLLAVEIFHCGEARGAEGKEGGDAQVSAMEELAGGGAEVLLFSFEVDFVGEKLGDIVEDLAIGKLWKAQVDL